jgi:hypothetical protein
MTQSGLSYRSSRQRLDVRRAEITLVSRTQALTSVRKKLALSDSGSFIDWSAEPDGGNSKYCPILNYEVRFDDDLAPIYSALAQAN